MTDEEINFHIDEVDTETFVNQIKKFENYDIEKFKNWFTPYKESKNFTEFWFYLINNLRYVGFRSIFESLGSLISADGSSFTQQILPYLVYYAIRFSEGEEVLENITNTVKEIIEAGSYTHKLIAFAIVDFIKVWLIQDKSSVESFITLETKFRFTEKLFSIDITYDQRTHQNKEIDTFIKEIDRYQVVKISLITVRRLQIFLNNLPSDSLYKAAKSAREYKRAVIYYEEHIRKTVLNKTASKLAETREYQKPLYLVEQNLEYDELKELIECYAKILPEDYDMKMFPNLNSKQMDSEYSQSLFNSTPRKRVEEGFGWSQVEQSLFITPFESMLESEDYNQKLYSLLDKKSHSKIQKLLNNICKF